MKLLVATPTLLSVHADYVVSLLETMQLLAERGHEVSWITSSCSPVARARDLIAGAFRQGPCEALLCVDGDLAWRAEDVVAMIDSGREFVSVTYRQRGVGNAPPPYGYTVGEVDYRQEPEAGCVRVRSNGFGLVLLSRSVVEKMHATYAPTLTYRIEGSAQTVVGLFHERIDARGCRRADDSSFFDRAVAAGIQPWLLLDRGTAHAGLPGNFGQEYARRRMAFAGVPARAAEATP